MSLLQTGLIVFSGLPIVATALLGYQLLRNGQGAIGKPSITAWLFYFTKFTIAFLLLSLFLASLKEDFFHYFPWLIQNEIPEANRDSFRGSSHRSRPLAQICVLWLGYGSDRLL